MQKDFVRDRLSSLESFVPRTALTHTSLQRTTAQTKTRASRRSGQLQGPETPGGFPVNYADAKTQAPRHPHGVPWRAHCSLSSAQPGHRALHREAERFPFTVRADRHSPRANPPTAGPARHAALLGDRREGMCNLEKLWGAVRWGGGSGSLHPLSLPASRPGLQLPSGESPHCSATPPSGKKTLPRGHAVGTVAGASSLGRTARVAPPAHGGLRDRL